MSSLRSRLSSRCWSGSTTAGTTARIILPIDFVVSFPREAKGLVQVQVAARYLQLDRKKNKSVAAPNILTPTITHSTHVV